MACGVSGSLYDLSGNLIQDTYPRLLQIGGGYLYNGSGSLVTSLNISGSISANTFYGDGSNLTGVIAELSNTGSFATTGSNNFIGNQIVTGSVSASAYSGDGNGLTFRDAFERDENNDLQPVIGNFHDMFWDKDVDGDIIPKDIKFWLDAEYNVIPLPYII